MKDTILGAAITVLASDGLNNWTVEEVANRSHCAKGLINYHYRTKRSLLGCAAETLRDDRAARRLAAVQTPGTQALDRLWEVMVHEVESGWFGAWMGLLAADDPLRKAAATNPAEASAFASALSRSLGVDTQLASQAPLIEAALDGLQLRLLQGAPVGETEEAYHRFWVSALV
ncbi:MAG TPA: TetR family transcriptional regulator [Gemmatimonadales bacterium]|jgi:AcrR family transcriptional regulator|nr:TetR family transcriptional regulator [Gemmatimonadales bacterium]